MTHAIQTVKTAEGKGWILYVGQELPHELSHQSNIPVIHIPMRDGREIGAKIVMALCMIDTVLSAQDTILVSCRSGISRSPTLCVGYLYWKCNVEIKDCIDHVKLVNPNYTPNPDFLSSVIDTVELMKELNSAEYGGWIDEKS